jgi:hypothetical protein
MSEHSYPELAEVLGSYLEAQGELHAVLAEALGDSALGDRLAISHNKLRHVAGVWRQGGGRGMRRALPGTRAALGLPELADLTDLARSVTSLRSDPGDPSARERLSAQIQELLATLPAAVRLPAVLARFDERANATQLRDLSQIGVVIADLGAPLLDAHALLASLPDQEALASSAEHARDLAEARLEAEWLAARGESPLQGSLGDVEVANAALLGLLGHLDRVGVAMHHARHAYVAPEGDASPGVEHVDEAAGRLTRARDALRALVAAAPPSPRNEPRSESPGVNRERLFYTHRDLDPGVLSAGVARALVIADAHASPEGAPESVGWRQRTRVRRGVAEVTGLIVSVLPVVAELGAAHAPALGRLASDYTYPATNTLAKRIEALREETGVEPLPAFGTAWRDPAEGLPTGSDSAVELPGGFGNIGR